MTIEMPAPLTRRTARRGDKVTITTREGATYVGTIRGWGGQELQINDATTGKLRSITNVTLTAVTLTA